MKKRVNYCDALRIFAILSVILIHVVADFRDYFLVTNKFYYGFITFIDSFTRMGVPIFFIITGIFMLSDKKEYTYKEFLKKRMPKLVIPFFIISIFYFLYEALKGSYPLSIISFIELFTSNGIKYHFWFMYMIILIYLLIPFLKVLVQKLSKKELLNLIFVIFIMGNCLATVNTIFKGFNLNILGAFVFPDIIKYINYLFLGFYISNYGVEKKYYKKLFVIGMCCLLIMPIADYFITSDVRLDLLLVASSALPFLSSLALFTFVREYYDKFKFPEKIKLFFSNSAGLVFYIYMIHVLVLDIVKKILFNYINPFSFINSIIFMMISFVITCFASYLLAYLLNRLYNFCERKLCDKSA